MKTFACASCGGVIFFENDRCVRCGHALGFLPREMELATFAAPEDNLWTPIAGLGRGHAFRPCANGREHSVCNWYLGVDEPEELCYSCRLNLMIPDLKVPGNVDHWRLLEIAKRRLIYSLLSLSLPTSGFSPTADPHWPALRFQFLAQIPGGPAVPTAHHQGVITVDVAEADPVERERRRKHLHEPQRTLLGHFRHESGHYYWGALIAGSQWSDQFRTLFGDESASYDSALASYYANGPSAGWESRFISAYASSHPWEDWAETWAHYLHMIDLIETSHNYSMRPEVPERPSSRSNTDLPAASRSSIDEMLDQWFPLVAAANSLNRSMGLPDLYPFVLAGAVIDKLRFVHDVISSRAAERNPAAALGKGLTASSDPVPLHSATSVAPKPQSAATGAEQDLCLNALMP